MVDLGRDPQRVENLLGIMDIPASWTCTGSGDTELDAALDANCQELKREHRACDHMTDSGFKSRLHALLRRHD